MSKEAATTAESFARYHDSPASRLRYLQAQHNLSEMHNLRPSLRVLDAAGGNGLNTEYFLREGHVVTLLDSDPKMLQQARARLSEANLLERCRLEQGTLESISDRLAGEQFDLILCHHVLEYTDQAPNILRAFSDLATSAGELSLITLNPVSEVIRAVVFRQDPILARSKLTDMSYDAKWFGQATLYPFEQIAAWSEQGGWTLRDFRAIRVLADYLPQEGLTKEREEELLAAEKEMAGREPYRRIGRYLQFCLVKNEGS